MQTTSYQRMDTTEYIQFDFKIKDTSTGFSLQNPFCTFVYLYQGYESVPFFRTMSLYLSLWVCTFLYSYESVPFSIAMSLYLSLELWVCTFLYSYESVPFSIAMSLYLSP